GLSVGSQVELGEGLRVRAAATGELAAHWPEAQGLLPPSFGREVDRLCVLELERSLERGAAEPPDAPGEIADAVTALRLSTAAPAWGRLLCEPRCCWARRRGSARRCSTGSARWSTASRAAGRRPTRFGSRSSRRCGTAIARACSPLWTSPSWACARGRGRRAR